MLINAHSAQEIAFEKSSFKNMSVHAPFIMPFDKNENSRNVSDSTVDSIQNLQNTMSLKENTILLEKLQNLQDSLGIFYQIETKEQLIQNLIDGKINLDEYVRIESEQMRNVVNSETFQDIQIQNLAFVENLKQQGIDENEIRQLNTEEFQALKESFFKLLTAFEIMQETQKDFERKIIFDTDDFILQLLTTNQVPQLKLSNQANLVSLDTESFLARYFNQALDDLTLLDRADVVLQKIKHQKKS